MSGYDTDLVNWSEHQAELRRRMGAGERVNDLVDWENVAQFASGRGRNATAENCCVGLRQIALWPGRRVPLI